MNFKNKSIYNRRMVLKTLGLAVGASLLSKFSLASDSEQINNKLKKVLTIAHITEVHMRPEHNAPNRFRKCIEKIKEHNIDFILNGGDTIYAADYSHIKRKRVLEQLDIWNELRNEIDEYEIFSCLGNHDMWWAAPNKLDKMYGKDYVVNQLKIPNRYYSFGKEGWHFIVLDSNNNAGALDEKQRLWLEKDLEKLNREVMF